MPIRPENRARYPKDWPQISLARREAAGWKCEWCGAENAKPHPVTGSRVVLTVAHVHDPTPENVAPENLAALCQRCHLNHDRKHHLALQASNRRAAMGVQDMFAPRVKLTAAEQRMDGLADAVAESLPQ